MFDRRLLKFAINRILLFSSAFIFCSTMYGEIRIFIVSITMSNSLLSKLRVCRDIIRQLLCVFWRLSTTSANLSGEKLISVQSGGKRLVIKCVGHAVRERRCVTASVR